VKVASKQISKKYGGMVWNELICTGPSGKLF